MVLLQTSFLKEENHSDETLNLPRQVSFQLVHPSLDHQRNVFMGCDCPSNWYSGVEKWPSAHHPHQPRNTALSLLPLWADVAIVLTFALCRHHRRLAAPLRAGLVRLARHLKRMPTPGFSTYFDPRFSSTFLSRLCAAAERVVKSGPLRAPVPRLREFGHKFFQPTLALAA